jgi:hypothetical protein
MKWRVATLALLISALVLSVWAGRIGDSAIVSLLVLLQIGLLVWLVRHQQRDG